MSELDTVVAFAQAQIADVRSAAADAQNDLTNVAEGHLSYFTFNAIPDYTPETGYTSQNVDLGEVEPFTVPDVTLSEYERLVTSEAAPFVKPEMAGFSPQTCDPNGVSGEITDFATKVLEFINSGGPGISAEVQTALADNMRERDLQALSDALLNVATSDALSGFPFPTSMTMAARNELIKKYQDDRSNRNRDITALMTERAHQTALKALDSGISLTQIKSGLQAEVWKLYYSMQGLILEEFKVNVAAEVSRYEADIRKLLADYDILKTRALTESGINLDRFRVEAEGESLRVKSDLTLATAGADIQLKSNELNFGVMLKEAELQLTKWVETVKNLTERGKADIAQISDSNLRRVEAGRIQADYYKGIVTGFANMVNTIQSKKF